MAMEAAVDKEFSALGGLFQHIITELKNSAPIWEDFILKSGKFHAQLKSTILASTLFLDSFQKIADMATSTKGATKEIGSALTRLCLRQRSVEAKMKIFTNALQENLIEPLSEKLEDWKKLANNLDKEHAKEYKRAKQELKKKSSDTLKLQKKVRKVGVIDIRRTLDYALQDVTDQYLLLEEIEKQSVRKALIDERSHFCLFVGYLQPVLESELSMLNEVNHIQEIIDTLSKITVDPYLLPEASEQVIIDVKKSENTFAFHATPPGSPGSLGSRKSSVCSISSINSSSSGSLPSRTSRHLSQSQKKSRKHLNSVASQDSGFTSQDALYVNNAMANVESQLVTFQEAANPYDNSAIASWPNLPESRNDEATASDPENKYQRPHTISSAYEKSNHRPPLTVHTFMPLDQSPEFQDNNYATISSFKSFDSKFKERNYSSQPVTPIYNRPSLPERSEDMYRPKPTLPEKSATVKAKHDKIYSDSFKMVPDFNRILSDQVLPYPVYANAAELLRRKTVHDEIYSRRCESDSEVQSRKEFAAVLNEGLLKQTKFGRSDKSMSDNESFSGMSRSCRQNGTISETLPRSRDSIAEDPILEAEMENLSILNHYYPITQNSLQRRPMSIAGISSGFLLPRKASTLHRSNSGFKPPTPVRRSSSITSSASQNKLAEANSLDEDITPIEMMKASRFRELHRSHSTLSSYEKFGYNLKHVETRSSENSPRNGPDISPTENSIVTDVSSSRAKLIHDLNLTFQQKPFSPKKPDAPTVPPKNVSKHHPNHKKEKGRSSHATAEQNHRGISSNHVHDAKLQNNHSGQYGHNHDNSHENIYGRSSPKTNHIYTAKPALIGQFQCQKPRLKDCLSQGDLRHCANEWERINSNSTHEWRQMKNSNEDLLKRSFAAAMNAKLDDHEKPHIASWLKNHEPRMWPPPAYRESLMDQIRRGTRLRRVKSNDRSQPKLA